MVGFNLADVTGVRPEAVSRVNSLTGDIKALVWVGLGVPSDDLTFQAIVKQFKVNDKVYGFYLYDSPSLTLDDDPNAVKLSIPPHEERLQ